MLGVAGVFGGSLFSAMHGSLVTSSLIRETTENESANEGYRFSQEEETYNIVAAHGYFGRLIFRFNNSRSLHFFLAAWPLCMNVMLTTSLEERLAAVEAPSKRITELGSLTLREGTIGLFIYPSLSTRLKSAGKLWWTKYSNLTFSHAEEEIPCVGVGGMISRLNSQVFVQPELDKATRAVSRITYGLVAVGKADGYSFEVVIDQVNSTDEDKLVSFIGSGGCQTHFKKQLVARELALFNPEKFMNLRLPHDKGILVFAGHRIAQTTLSQGAEVARPFVKHGKRSRSPTASVDSRTPSRDPTLRRGFYVSIQAERALMGSKEEPWTGPDLIELGNMETDLLNRSGGDKRIRNTGVIAEWRQFVSFTEQDYME
ncbi:unnamed protein product [Cochlearia groenlandica]